MKMWWDGIKVMYEVIVCPKRMRWSEKIEKEISGAAQEENSHSVCLKVSFLYIIPVFLHMPLLGTAGCYTLHSLIS